jgi:hypothetical protein
MRLNFHNSFFFWKQRLNFTIHNFDNEPLLVLSTRDDGWVDGWMQRVYGFGVLRPRAHTAPSATPRPTRGLDFRGRAHLSAGNRRPRPRNPTSPVTDRPAAPPPGVAGFRAPPPQPNPACAAAPRESASPAVPKRDSRAPGPRRRFCCRGTAGSIPPPMLHLLTW